MPCVSPGWPTVSEVARVHPAPVALHGVSLQGDLRRLSHRVQWPVRQIDRDWLVARGSTTSDFLRKLSKKHKSSYTR